MLRHAARIPLCTYRVQLHGDFRFAALTEQVDYLQQLGVTDFYLSPIFTATPGSRHGYDVNDYSSINPELGGEEAFRVLVQKIQAHGGGVLLDIVPNHMGIAGPLNGWWRDVLEHGRNSSYAGYFDIDWNTQPTEERPRVLVPILEDHYGRVVEDAKIKLVYDHELALRYGDVNLPVSPRTYIRILGRLAANDRLSIKQRAEAKSLIDDFKNLPIAAPGEKFEATRDRSVQATRLKERLAQWTASDAQIREALLADLQIVNGVGGDPGSFLTLHEIIAEQHYRLARWKSGAHEINYRRFFAIDSLVGLHMEHAHVFQESHRLIERLLQSGEVTGLRVDHIDGLRSPWEYLQRLQHLPRKDAGQPLYVAVEKILVGDETLQPDWAVHGATGYEFIPQMADVLVDRAAEEKLEEVFRRFTKIKKKFSEVSYEKKRLVLEELFGNAVTNLGSELAEIVAADRRWEDLTRAELIIAVREFMAVFPVYRTYRRSGQPLRESEADVIAEVYRQAIAENPRSDPSPFKFLRDVLVGKYPLLTAPTDHRDKLLNWVLTFQQYTGAVMAKAIEDTAFYTYNRFIARNEVGDSPARMGRTLEDFHRRNEERWRDAPHSLLTTSTHDTKLSEDVRARLYALSEMPDEWGEWVQQWHDFNRKHRTSVDGKPAPDRLDEFRCYQILLGAWPLQPEDVTPEFRERLKTHFRKSVDEAKRHTSPMQPNLRYLEAFDRFVERITDPETAEEFLDSFVPCARRLAELGRSNSLVQLVMKCTVPGVPDIYQGNEIWDFSLVDPDNRRPIDYGRRRQLLAAGKGQSWADALRDWRHGGIKLRVTEKLLSLRKAHAELFQRGNYERVKAHGEAAEHVIAFRRTHREESLLVIALRLGAGMNGRAMSEVWQETGVSIGGNAASIWTDIFTGRAFASGEPWPVKELLAELPFCVLMRSTENNLT